MSGHRPPHCLAMSIECPLMTTSDPEPAPVFDLNAAIAAEDDAVGQALELLSERRQLSEWPAELRTALAGALATDPSDIREGRKARRLAAHLFGGLPAELRPSPEHRRTRLAERFRADLADLVPAGTGLYLVDFPPP